MDDEGRLVGALTRSQMIAAGRDAACATRSLLERGTQHPTVMSPFTTLRTCAVAMAESKYTAFPVVASDGKFLGIITLEDLLKGRSEQAHRESTRQRVLRLRWPFSNRAQPAVADVEITLPVTATGAAPPQMLAAATDADEVEALHRG